jgi:hypothetical protein
MDKAPRRPRRFSRLAVPLAAAALLATSFIVAINPAQAADEAIAVDFSVAGAAPTYRASGWIYGMTENASGPPDNFYRDVNFRYMRAGGAQLDSPGGWVSGRYDRRWNSTRAQLLRTRALGGEFILLPHDLWGADGFPISRFPGDNGTWTDYDNFLTRLVNDVRATGAPVQWDLWNEPNITLFWNRPIAQYFELWRRTYQRIRAEFPGHLIVGPSCACVPTTSGFWTQFLDFARANNVVPDIFSWHSLPGDPVANVATANSTLDSRGIAHPRPYQINEYGAGNEQNPGDGSWYITRLERAGADGLRANWAGGGNLHNDLGNLLIRNAAGQHQPKGEWWVYRFYATQTGQIVSVTPSASYDAFATRASGSAKVLIGGGRTTGNIAVTLRRLDAITGVVRNNQVRVLVNRIPYNNGGAVTGPVTQSDTVVTLSNNAATVNVPNNDVNQAYTIELLPPGVTQPTTPPTGSWERITSRHSGLVVDVSNVSTADGAPVHQWQWLSGANQQWQFQDAGSGFFRVVARHSGKCLDVSGVSTADGAVVHQWTCTSGQNQQWQWVAAADGFFTLRARHSGKCLDVSNFSTANGGSLVQWTCTGGANQQWSRSAV